MAVATAAFMVNRSFLWRLLSLPSRAGGHVVAMAASGLPVLAFLLKFMEWWQSDEGTASRQAARSTLQLPIPPPPTTAVCHACDACAAYVLCVLHWYSCAH